MPVADRQDAGPTEALFLTKEKCFPQITEWSLFVHFEG